MNGRLDGLDLFHHLLVDMEPACGIDDDHFPCILSRMLDGVLRNGHGSGFPVRIDRHVNLFPQSDQLVDGGGTMHVRCNEKGRPALRLQVGCQLCRKGCLAGSLKAGHHDDGGRHGGERNIGLGGAEQLHHLVKNNLDDELTGGYALENFLTDGPFLDVIDELFGDLVVDIGIEEDTPDLAQGLGHIRLRDFALPAQSLEYTFQLETEVFKHYSIQPK